MDYIKASQQREETEEELWKQEKNRVLIEGTPISKYLARNFARIKTALGLSLERLPQVELQIWAANHLRSYLEISIKE